MHTQWQLRHRLILPFLALVAFGSLLIMVTVQWINERAEKRDLLAVAEAHAEFLKDTAFPPSIRLAGNLGLMAHATMAFRYQGRLLCGETNTVLVSALEDTPTGGSAVRARAGYLVATAPVENDYDLLLARPESGLAGMLSHPTVLSSLLAFWLLALLLGIIITRGLVTPLRALAGALPRLGGEAPLESLPGMERGDELGLLARTFLTTHDQLREERDKRMRAERMAVLGRMSTGLAHEIQNPVAAIRLHTQLLQSTPAPSRSQQLDTAIPHVLGALDRITSLVNQWLFLARPEPPKLAPVEVDRFLDDVFDRMQQLLTHGGVDVVRKGQAGLRVQADPRRLEHVVQNLVINAVQAMGGRGRLDVALRREGKNVLMTFTDTGPGFSAEALKRGSELFYSEKEGGMGVGLTLCNEVVQAHGGRIALANRPEGGAEVTVELPEAEASS